MKFQVITKAPEPTESQGNLAAAFELYTVNPRDPNDKPKLLTMIGLVPAVMVLREPVFHVGELLIVDDDGREIPYPRRKVSKWEVEHEEFGWDQLEAALERSWNVWAAAQGGLLNTLPPPGED